MAGFLMGLATSATAAPAAEDALYERAAVLAADARCKLFDAKTRAALEAAMVQARGAMIRGGAPAKSVESIERFAASAGNRWDCNSPDMKVIAGRVESAFSAYHKYTEMRFPGDVRTWIAQRYTAERTARWRVFQTAKTSQAQYGFGVAEFNGQKGLLLVVDGELARPRSVVLMMRDPRRAPEPVGAGFLNSVTFRSTDKNTPLKDRVPPYGATQPFFAKGKMVADASLTQSGQTQAMAYLFPDAAINHLENLDPREAIEARLTIPARGNRPEYVERVYFEVGDFAAARAFIRAAAS